MLGVQAMRRRRLSGVLNHEDARRSARRVLPRLLFDYIDGGADDEVTLRRNSEAFDDLWLRPRMGEWTPRPVLATEVLGTELSMPVLTAPCGGMRLVHPAGDLAVARGRSEPAWSRSCLPGAGTDQVASASGSGGSSSTSSPIPC